MFSAKLRSSLHAHHETCVLIQALLSAEPLSSKQGGKIARMHNRFVNIEIQTAPQESKNKIK